MSKENKTSDKTQNGNNFIFDVIKRYKIQGYSFTTNSRKWFEFSEKEWEEFKYKRWTHYPAWSFNSNTITSFNVWNTR